MDGWGIRLTPLCDFLTAQMTVRGSRQVPTG
jgi:hypothetical protein